MKARILSILMAICLQAMAIAQSPPGSQSQTASEQFHKLLNDEWERNMREWPTWASNLGDRRYNDRWPDVSIAAHERRNLAVADALNRLTKIDRSKLSLQDQLSYDLFRKESQRDLESHALKTYLLPLNQRWGIQTEFDLAEQLRFEVVKDYEDWIARLRAFPAYADQTLELLKEGRRQGMLWPKITLERVPAQLDKLMLEDPEDSPFFKPFREFPDTISEGDRARVSASAKEAISQGIVPAFRRLKEYFVAEYLPAAFDEVGIWQWPNGAQAYATLARHYTTTDLTPQQIHETGLQEVARIRAEMQKVMAQVGFTGTLKEFFQKLRTDKQFYYEKPEELLEAYRAMSKRIDPGLVKLFKTLPRTPYGVIPIPDQIAPDTTTAYYQQPAADGSRAGYYYVNLYKPEARPKWEMMALSLHEAVPGHHLQIALAMELGELPKFRKYGGYTAYIEGWALYAEALGDEMGLYDDPYSKFGQLTYEMWRAVRLVVDTGMHAMKWDRQRAIDYFLDNAPKTELDVVNEIDRYITNPGQALAYKIGELKIKELRKRSEGRLGEAFDIREFHDVVLSSGAVPLDVLEGIVETWLSSKAK